MSPENLSPGYARVGPVVTIAAVLFISEAALAHLEVELTLSLLRGTVS
jgi:hypothetical protein